MLTTAAFPAKATFDSSRTPTRGERIEKRALKPLDLDKLKARLATVEAEAKANDPRALKAEVARLTRELAAAQKAGPAAAWPDQRQLVEALTAELSETSATLERLRTGALELQHRQEAALTALTGEKVEMPVVTVSQRRVVQAPVPVERQPSPARAQPKHDGSVPHGCAKPLAALAAVYPSGLTEPQWATAAGYKRSGGTWGTYKSRLTGADLIEKRGDRYFATEVGATAVGDVEMPPPPGPDLVRWWAAKLHGTSKIAEALIEAWPKGLSKDELADRIGMTVSGGSFGTYLSRLAGPGLITRDGEIRLSDEVMGG